MSKDDKHDHDIDEEDDDLDEYETISILDEDGEEVEFAILDAKEKDGVTYLLVLEVEDLDDDDAEASILHSVKPDDEELTEDEVAFEFVEDEDEFNQAAALFQEGNDEYELEK